MMAKKKGNSRDTGRRYNGSDTSAGRAAEADKGATLKDLLNPDILNKLKAQATEMKAEEEKRREEARKQAEDARKAEQKRLENDFEHLLNTSKMDWKTYK